MNNCSIWPFFCLAVLFLWSSLKVCSSLFLSCSLGVVLCYVFILSMESSCLRVPALILLCQFDSSKGLCSGKDNQSVKKTDFYFLFFNLNIGVLGNSPTKKCFSTGAKVMSCGRKAKLCKGKPHCQRQRIIELTPQC